MILFGLALVAATARGADCSVFDRTRPALPKLTADDLRAVTAGPAGFVAVGANGAAVYSQDGVDWTRANSPTFNTLLSIGSGADGVVAVGERGFTMFSATGAQWEGSTAGRSNLNGVAFGNATWVTVGDAGTAFASADGRAWAPQQTGTTSNLVSLAFGSGLFVAASAASEVHVSSDGTNWTRFRLAAPLTHIRSVPGGFFGLTANNKIASSLDGRVWSVITDISLTGIEDIGTDGSTLYSVGVNGLLARSTPRLTWNNLTLPVTAQGRTLYGVASANGIGVAVGEKGLILSFDAGGTVQSLNKDKFDDFLSIAFGNGTFVLVGENGVAGANSGDLANDWVFGATGTTNHLTGVAFGAGRFVAVGGTSTNVLETQSVQFITSVNGTNWTHILNLNSVTNPVNSATGYVTDIVFGEDRFVAVGPHGVALVSTNGLQWTVHGSPNLVGLSRVTYTDGRFMATGTGVATSDDGIKWNLMMAPAAELPYNGIAGVKGSYTVIGSIPSALVTTNLIDWSTNAISGSFTNGLFDIIYAGEQYVAVGRAAARAAMTFSYDSVTWTTRQFSTTTFFRSVAFGKRRFVFVGDRGVVYFSTEIDSNTGLPGPSTWVRTNGGLDRDAAMATALDPACGHYVGGQFRGTVNFAPGVSLTATGDPSFYVARYDDIGNATWAVSGEGVASVNKLVAQRGIVFAGGSSPNGIALAGGEVWPSEGIGAFVSSFDDRGAPLWLRQIPGTVSDVILAKDSTIKYSGLFAQRIAFGEELLMESTNVPNSFYLIKADLIGTNLWGRYIIPKPNVFLDGMKLASDSKSATFAAGTANGALEFWETQFIPAVEGGEPDAFTGWSNKLSAKLTVSNGPAVFLSKYDANGKLLWVTNTGLTGAILTAAAPSVGEGVLLAGNSGSVMFVSRFASNGAPVWTKTFDAQGSAQLTAFTTTTNGYAIGAGYFQGELTLGKVTLSTGGTACFVFHMDPFGVLSNVRSYGTAPALVGYSTPSALAAESTREYLLAGYYDERVSFGPGALITRGLSDGFLARLRTPPATPGRLESIVTETDIEFSFPLGYALQFSTEITGGDWVTISGTSPVTVPRTSGSGFYRLIWP